MDINRRSKAYGAKNKNPSNFVAGRAESAFQEK
jgi:hypothetical protein